MTPNTRELRQRRRGLTDKMLASMRRRTKRYIVSDPDLRGHYVRVPPQGPIVFAAVARDPLSKQVWAKVGTTAELTIGQARERAREAIRRIKQGKLAFEPPKPKPESVAVVCASWLKRHVEKNNFRTTGELRRIVERYILPYWADRVFTEIRRKEIAALLDVIEDKHGAAVADAVLKTLRSIANWVQARDDAYVPPFIKGMRRVPENNRERERILDDDELRRVWNAAGEAGNFGATVRLLLLTAQRREKVRTLRWDDISPEGVWTIRTEDGEKGNAGALQLPEIALQIINAQPRYATNQFVFAGIRDAAFKTDNRLKRKLDAKSGVSDWRLHDLRRTARSLMSRAGVLSEHAERVLGHAIDGVEGIYNRHEYFDEKAAALRRLAALIERMTSIRPAPMSSRSRGGVVTKRMFPVPTEYNVRALALARRLELDIPLEPLTGAQYVTLWADICIALYPFEGPKPTTLKQAFADSGMFLPKRRNQRFKAGRGKRKGDKHKKLAPASMVTKRTLQRRARA